MCDPGYFGPFCRTPCPSGSFGPECGGFCFPKCSNATCDHVLGCPEQPRSTPLTTISGTNQTLQQVLITTQDPLVSTEENLMVMNENSTKDNVFQPMYMYLLVGFSFVFVLFLFVIIMEFYVKYRLSKRKCINIQDMNDNN